MDLCKFDTIRAFAKSYIESKKPIHILMNNAGVMAIKERQVTDDGNEVQVIYIKIIIYNTYKIYNRINKRDTKITIIIIK